MRASARISTTIIKFEIIHKYLPNVTSTVLEHFNYTTVIYRTLLKVYLNMPSVQS